MKSKLNIQDYKTFDSLTRWIDSEFDEQYDWMNKCIFSKFTSFTELVKGFMEGELTQKNEDEFCSTLATSVECGAQPIIWISNSDPNINTPQDAINYISRKTAEGGCDMVAQYDIDYLISDNEDFDNRDYLSYDDYLAKNGYKITNPDLDVMVGVCGKYWITIISIPG